MANSKLNSKEDLLLKSKKISRPKIEQLFDILQKGDPDPKTELNYNSAYELLVSVVLSAQATDISVNKATKALFLVANTPQKMLALGEENLKQYIKAIGLFNSKAKHIIALSHQLINQHQSTVPNDRKSLEALAGVGRKTANVVLNTYFNQPTIAVDTHVFRVSNRTGLALGANVDAVEEQLMKKVPKQFQLNAHHWLILHGRYTCTARKPKCDECAIAHLCPKNEVRSLN